jgi:hypothetical protein
MRAILRHEVIETALSILRMSKYSTHDCRTTLHDLADETVNAPRARRTRQYCSVAKRWLHGEPKYESLAVFPNADRFR